MMEHNNCNKEQPFLMSKDFRIPTITLVNETDFNHLNADSEIIKSLRHACEQIGFFYLQIDPSELSPKLMSNVFDQSKKFFALPTNLKEKISDSKLNRGYTKMGEETLDPSNQSEGDTKEGFYIANDVPADSELYNPAKLNGPNVWPTIDLMMSDDKHNSVQQFDCELWKDVMNEYFDRSKCIGLRLVRMIALSIGLPKDYFDDKFDPPMAFLRLLHYSQKMSEPDNGILGCGAHSDYGMVTLLATDDQPGLQILINKESQEEWVAVQPPPIGTFVVNLGDMLERWTNGKFKSTVHRVISAGNAERYSIPFFYEPHFDTIVECIDACLSEGDIPKYKTTTAGGHLLEKYDKTHASYSIQK